MLLGLHAKVCLIVCLFSCSSFVRNIPELSFTCYCFLTSFAILLASFKPSPSDFFLFPAKQESILIFRF